MYELKVVTRFAAAHRLAMVGAKCENMHGHNWTIEAHVTGERLDSAGVLIDFGVIKSRLREIIARLDHQFLNELEMFTNSQPTSERIATYVALELKKTVATSDLRISRVSAWESEDACATWVADGS
jgi:6-pyruvoyltetrahydropterin/6-carboxytetrahydropterin synthase